MWKYPNVQIYIDSLLYYNMYGNYNIKLFFNSINHLVCKKIKVGEYWLFIYKMNLKTSGFSSILHIRKEDNNNKLLFNQNNINYLKYWVSKNMKGIGWNNLVNEFNEFCIDNTRNKYREFCIKYSHKNLVKTKLLYNKNISVDKKLWNIIISLSNTLGNIIKKVYELHGYKKFEFKFDAYSIMQTLLGYFKKEHTDADGYLPIVGLLYFDLLLNKYEEKQITFESCTDYNWQFTNPNMTLGVKLGDYILFWGMYADKLKHRPLGGTEQSLLTFRGPTNKNLYKSV